MHPPTREVIFPAAHPKKPSSGKRVQSGFSKGGKWLNSVATELRSQFTVAIAATGSGNFLGWFQMLG